MWNAEFILVLTARWHVEKLRSDRMARVRHDNRAIVLAEQQLALAADKDCSRDRAI